MLNSTDIWIYDLLLTSENILKLINIVQMLMKCQLNGCRSMNNY